MKDNNRKVKIGNQIATVLATVVILLSIFWSAVLYRRMDFRVYENEIRVLAEEQNKEIEQGVYEQWEYPYLVCDLTGLVLYADEEFQKQEGEWVNVQEILRMDESFGKNYPDLIRKTFARIEEGEVTGFIVYLIPEDVLRGENYNQKMVRCALPACMGILMGIMLLVSRIFYCNKCILEPIREITVSASHMIRGNYEYEYKRIFTNKVNSDEMGKLIYSFELMRDELKAKQIQEESLKKAQQELISCISHDLKTPISTIKAYAEGLRDGIARDEKTRADYTRIMIEKTDFLIDMIEDLLNFSNAQLNQLDICCKEVFFLSFFEQAMREIEGFVQQNHMRFSYHADLEDRIVLIDERRILEVLYNLIENSMKYRKEDGAIEVIACKEGQNVLIRVIDNGIGIGSDEIPFVFDKFYRAEKSRTSSIPGSGLGLSICKYIIEQHGGQIYCKSRKDTGCEIGFTIH